VLLRFPWLAIDHDVWLPWLGYKRFLEPSYFVGARTLQGDFLQLSPTANIGLIQDVNEKRDDGSYKFAEPPTLEIQHAIRVFRSIPHVFELRGTKRFKANDPLIELLQCMRTGTHIPDGIWDAFLGMAPYVCCFCCSSPASPQLACASRQVWKVCQVRAVSVIV